MPLVTSTEMFKKAYDGGYAIGAFNCRPLSSSSCRNYHSRRRYYHHRYRRNRSRRCPDRSIPRSG